MPIQEQDRRLKPLFTVSNNERADESAPRQSTLMVTENRCRTALNRQRTYQTLRNNRVGETCKEMNHRN